MNRLSENYSCNNPKAYDWLPSETKRKLLSWIDKYFIPGKRVRYPPYYNTYGYKHAFSDDTGIYITNGEFKGAMRAAGYIPKDPADLNWEFKCLGFVWKRPEQWK